MCRGAFQEEPMNDNPFATLARDAAEPISRRASLRSLAAGLAALTALTPDLDAAAKKGKKKRNGDSNIARKAAQKCQRQENQCLDFFRPRCAGDQECAVGAIRCCQVAAECDAIGVLRCIEEE
jgi:hypothetical protein